MSFFLVLCGKISWLSWLYMGFLVRKNICIEVYVAFILHYVVVCLQCYVVVYANTGCAGHVSGQIFKFSRRRVILFCKGLAYFLGLWRYWPFSLITLISLIFFVASIPTWCSVVTFVYFCRPDDVRVAGNRLCGRWYQSAWSYKNHRRTYAIFSVVVSQFFHC